MANDIALAVGDGARRMTYAELAAVRGISAASAERLVRRRRWARQPGNDGIVRVLVPLAEARKRKPRAGSDSPPDMQPDVRISGLTSPLTSWADDPRTIRAFESAVAALREQLAAKDVVIDHLRGEIRFLHGLLSNRRPWWRRWFG